MGDDSPGRGLRVAPFAKLLCQVKNIEKGGSEDPPLASEPNEQPYIHMTISTDSMRDPKSDTKRSDPKKDTKSDTKRYSKRFSVQPVTWSRSPSPDKRSRKREGSPTSEGSSQKRVSAVRQESHNESEARPGKSKESDKSPNQSNSSLGFIFTSNSSGENSVNIAVHEDEVREARKAVHEKSDSHQKLFKERVSQTAVTDSSLRSSRSRSPCGSRDKKGEERSRKRKHDHQRSRSRSPLEKRERNLAPKEMQDERARLISSKNFLEE